MHCDPSRIPQSSVGSANQHAAHEKGSLPSESDIEVDDCGSDVERQKCAVSREAGLISIYTILDWAYV